MLKFFLFIFLFVPLFVFSQEYQNDAGAAQMVSDSFNEFWTFFFTDVPNFFHRLTAWLIVWLVKAQLYAQYELMQYAWTVSKVIIADLNIMTEINNQISILPPDLRQVLSDMHFLDGLTLILNAHMTKFVINFLRF